MAVAVNIITNTAPNEKSVLGSIITLDVIFEIIVLTNFID